MSDHEIELIPEDPRYVPASASADLALAYLRRLLPDADSVEATVDDEIVFRDCGENFESVSCPSCGAELDLDVWGELVDSDSDEQAFQLHSYPMPCCGKAHTLHELRYTAVQGLGRFALTIVNPNVDELSIAAVAEIERILACGVRVIQRIV